MPFASIAFRTDRPLLQFTAVVSTLVFSVGQHSVEVDLNVSQITCSFNYSSIKCKFRSCHSLSSIMQKRRVDLEAAT